MIVAVAGAAGFIGRARASAPDRAGFTLRGISRRGDQGSYDEWRACDLLSLDQTRAALEGATFAVYLVHSMIPSARLVQGSFADFDLLCADNFARAARGADVRHIVYVGGILPEGELSRHLASRAEVERALAGTGVPLTTLRAGLVIGAGGSSMEMLVRLIERLPVLVTPAWTETPAQPIAASDLASLVLRALGREELFGRAFDVGGPDVLTYRVMLEETARILGARRPMASVPFFTPKLSRLWVSAVTGAPRALVDPLIESLGHPMVARDRELQERLGVPGIGFEEAARAALAVRTPPHAYQRAAGGSNVRSVQRIPLPPGETVEWVAREYLRWLPRLRFLRAEVTGDRARFFLRGDGRLLLELALRPASCSETRCVFTVEGGALAATGGELEFRATPDGDSVLAYVHDFVPALPFAVYERTQAVAHLWVMGGFGRHLARLTEASKKAISPRPAS